jgi:hypothetical protein
MSDKDFINSKLLLMKQDKQPVFDGFVGPLQEIAKQGELGNTVKIPVDGNWFMVSFDAVEVKKDRLVIQARRLIDGLKPVSHDPSEKEYWVEFAGTRAAYLRGFYKSRHPMYGWPYLYWDVRSYANHPDDPAKRIYVHGFHAHEELRKLIFAMEGAHGTSNIYNKYINDNLIRYRQGIRAGKTPEEIEKAWSKGMMESLGYNCVEAFDTGHPKGNWQEVHAHWCKKKQDLRG